METTIKKVGEDIRLSVYSPTEKNARFAVHVVTTPEGVETATFVEFDGYGDDITNTTMHEALTRFLRHTGALP